MFRNSDSAVQDHFRQEHPLESKNIKWKILHYGLNNYFKRIMIESMYIKESQGSRLMNGCVSKLLRT